MESTWARATPFLHFNVSQINNLIRASGVQVVHSELLEQGKANTNYRITSEEGQTFVLRCYQRDSNCLALEEALSTLLYNELPVPKFLFIDKNVGLALVEFMPGKTLADSLNDQAKRDWIGIARSLGTALAKISSFKFESAGFLNSNLSVRDPWESTLGGLWGHLETLLLRPLVEERTGPVLFRRMRSSLKPLKNQLARVIGKPCLVHGDFKVSNLLVESGRLTGILDWEFAHSGTFLLDIGLLFRDYENLPPGFEERFAEGFMNAGGTLFDNWLDSARLIDLVSLVDFLSRPPSGLKMVSDINRMVESTLDNAERLGWL